MGLFFVAQGLNLLRKDTLVYNSDTKTNAVYQDTIQSSPEMQNIAKRKEKEIDIHKTTTIPALSSRPSDTSPAASAHARAPFPARMSTGIGCGQYWPN
jgi:hypothetical protein